MFDFNKYLKTVFTLGKVAGRALHYPYFIVTSYVCSEDGDQGVRLDHIISLADEDAAAIALIAELEGIKLEYIPSEVRDFIDKWLPIIHTKSTSQPVYIGKTDICVMFNYNEYDLHFYHNDAIELIYKYFTAVYNNENHELYHAEWIPKMFTDLLDIKF